jgi:hypothetical protein
MSVPLHAVPDPDQAPRRQTGWNAVELMNTEFPPPRWAVPGLISEGLNLLVGGPKLGKSWLSLGLAAAISTGQRALGSTEVQQGPVLYLALEDTGRRLQKRLSVMAAGGWRPSPHLQLETSCPHWTAGGEALVAEWLEANPDARLVIIDTFEKIRGRSGSTASAYGDDYVAASRIKAVADHYGVPILVVHHVRKAGADDFLDLVSGTNGIPGAADTILVLERPRGQADGVLHVVGRDVDEADHAMTFNPDAGTWTRLDGPALDHTLHEARAAILRYLREHPGSGPSAIADGTGLKPASVRQTCRRMAADGQLRVTPGGKYHPADDGDDEATSQASPPSPFHQTSDDQHKHR